MTQVIVFLALVAAAMLLAALVDRRSRPAPTRTGYAVPEQLDRTDFTRPEAPWLVVLFSSSTCNSCARARRVIEPVESGAVAVHDVEYDSDRALHERYRIEAVPTLVIADAEGVVRGRFLGPPTAADLWAALAEIREPGTVPPGCDHGAPGGA